MLKPTKNKRKVSDAARARHYRIYERFLVQRAIGDKWSIAQGLSTASSGFQAYQLVAR